MADEGRSLASRLAEAMLTHAGEAASDLGVEQGHVFVIVCHTVEPRDVNHFKAVSSMQAGGLSGEPDRDGIDTADAKDVIATLLVHLRNAAEDAQFPVAIIPGRVGLG